MKEIVGLPSLRFLILKIAIYVGLNDRENSICVAVNFLFQLIFVFPLFLGMVMHANEFETKEKQKLTEIKNKLQHM